MGLLVLQYPQPLRHFVLMISRGLVFSTTCSNALFESVGNLQIHAYLRLDSCVGNKIALKQSFHIQATP